MANGELPDWDRIVDRHAKRVFRVALRIWDPSRMPKTCLKTCSPKPSGCTKRAPFRAGRGCSCGLRRCDPSIGCAANNRS